MNNVKDIRINAGYQTKGKANLNTTRQIIDSSLHKTRNLVVEFIETNKKTYLDPKRQEEISRAVVLLQRIEKLIIKTDNSIYILGKKKKLKELNALVCSVQVALISLFQEQPDMELAQRMRIDIERVVYQYEYSWLGFGHAINFFMHVYRSESVQLKVISGLTFSFSISVTFIVACLLIFYFKPESEIEKQINQQQKFINQTSMALLERIADINQQSVQDLKSEAGIGANSSDNLFTAAAITLGLSTEDIISNSLANNLKTHVDTLSILRKQRNLEKEKSELALITILVVSSGVLGSIVSILTRIENIDQIQDSYLKKHKEPDPLLPMFLGAFKPIIGASFGLLFFAFINSGIISIPSIAEAEDYQDEFFFCSVAFLVGFSERLAKDIISKAETVIGGGALEASSQEVLETIGNELEKISEDVENLKSLTNHQQDLEQGIQLTSTTKQINHQRFTKDTNEDTNTNLTGESNLDV